MARAAALQEEGDEWLDEAQFEEATVAIGLFSREGDPVHPTCVTDPAHEAFEIVHNRLATCKEHMPNCCPKLTRGDRLRTGETGGEAQRNCVVFIHPDAGWRGWWDLVLMLFILYVAFCIPLRIGFDLEVKPFNAWFIIDIFADVAFLLDLFFNFRTGFSDGFNVMQSDGLSMAKHYIGWPVEDPFWTHRFGLTKEILQGKTSDELRRVAQRCGISLRGAHTAHQNTSMRLDGNDGLIDQILAHNAEQGHAIPW
jgi:hypothetical protein